MTASIANFLDSPVAAGSPNSLLRKPRGGERWPRWFLRNSTSPPNEDEFAALESNIYALCKTKRDREAIAEALEYFDDRLIARRFADCNRALRQLRVGKLASSVMVSILGITIQMRKSKSRATFFERALQEITRQKGKKYASELLAKYR